MGEVCLGAAQQGREVQVTVGTASAEPGLLPEGLFPRGFQKVSEKQALSFNSPFLGLMKAHSAIAHFVGVHLVC